MPSLRRPARATRTCTKKKKIENYFSIFEYVQINSFTQLNTFKKMEDPMIKLASTEQPKRGYLRNSTLIGIVIAVVYGLTLRLLLDRNWPFNSGIWVLTSGFLFGGPLVIGLVTVNGASVSLKKKVWFWFLGPWLPTSIVCALAFLFRIEGAICIVMGLPIMLFGSSVGGLIAGLYARKLNRSTTVCIAILPLLLAPAQARLKDPTQFRTVSSEIRIHAPAALVWQNIARVPSISPAELQPNWTHRIGFPRPVEATLSYEGVGGVRHASFERGLLFIETVTAWDPEHRLAFGIHADTAHIPPTTLDQHVTIGGRYFDVLDGEYRVESLSSGDVLLHLTSHQRLSTGFNEYAGLWTDAVMQNLQTSILEVIQHRCEARKL
jgi:hypothetical protein